MMESECQAIDKTSGSASAVVVEDSLLLPDATVPGSSSMPLNNEDKDLFDNTTCNLDIQDDTGNPDDRKPEEDGEDIDNSNPTPSNNTSSSTEQNVDDDDPKELSIAYTTDFKQPCCFCDRKFKNSSDLLKHLEACNSSIKKLVIPKHSMCIICKKVVPDDNLIILAHHAVVCFIAYLKKRFAEEKEHSVPVDKIIETMVIPVEPEGEPYVDTYREPNEEQEAILMTAFNINIFPSEEERQNVAEKIGFSIPHVKEWFARARLNFGKPFVRNDAVVVEDLARQDSVVIVLSENEATPVIMMRLHDEIDQPEMNPVPTTSTNCQIKTAQAIKQLPKVQQKCIGSDMISKKHNHPYGVGMNHSPNILKILKERFSNNPAPSMMEYFTIGKETGLRIRQLKSWFWMQRRRSAMLTDIGSTVMDFDGDNAF